MFLISVSVISIFGPVGVLILIHTIKATTNHPKEHHEYFYAGKKFLLLFAAATYILALVLPDRFLADLTAIHRVIEVFPTVFSDLNASAGCTTNSISCDRFYYIYVLSIFTCSIFLAIFAPPVHWRKIVYLGALSSHPSPFTGGLVLFLALSFLATPDIMRIRDGFYVVHYSFAAVFLLSLVFVLSAPSYNHTSET